MTPKFRKRKVWERGESQGFIKDVIKILEKCAEKKIKILAAMTDK